MNIPHNSFFRFLSGSDAEHLNQYCRKEHFKKGKKIDLKKFKSFGIIENGLFESQTRRSENLYLGSGSFFGPMPFSATTSHSVLNSVTDSSVLVFDNPAISSFFLKSYKRLRGYAKKADCYGFELDEFNFSSKIITIFSKKSGAGKSLLSAYCASGFRKEKTIILSVSNSANSGDSVFSLFGKNPGIPVSEKHESENIHNFLNGRIISVNENLSLMNISHGSRVKVNPAIISPVILYLSSKFRYIIIDMNDFDESLTQEVLKQSDFIFILLKTAQEKENYYQLLDLCIQDCQRVYYLLNRFFAKNTASFEGGYIIDDLFAGGRTTPENIFDALSSAANEKEHIFSKLVVKNRNALVLQTENLNSLLYIPLFMALYESENAFDIIFSSAWTSMLAMLFLLTDISGFTNNVNSLFRKTRLNSFLEITWPHDFLFKNAKLSAYAQELFGHTRMESLASLPAVMLYDNHRVRKTFSTGFLKDLFSASFFFHPLCEPAGKEQQKYLSGYPECVSPDDLYRADIDSITYFSVENKNLLLNTLPINNLFIKLSSSPRNTPIIFADKTITIGTDIETLSVPGVLSVSEVLKEKILLEFKK